MNIDRAELDHIMSEFTRNNMYYDMAMFFITQDIDYDDVFSLDYHMPVSFYKNVFDVIYKYVLNKIDKGQLDSAIRDVFTKLRCYNYLTKPSLQEVILRDCFSSRLIEYTLKYLVRDGDLDSANFVIDNLMINPEVNNNVIFEIMMKNPELCHQHIISNMISGEYLDISQVLELILERAKVTPMSTIKELVLEIFNNKEMLLHFAACVYQQYRIWVEPKSDKNTVVHIDNINKGERAEHINNIRDFLIEIIWIDAELEYFDFLNEAKMRHKHDKNLYLAGVYDTYVKWFGSKMREDNSFRNMLWCGYEEDLGTMNIDIECLAELSRDIVNLIYITDMEMLDGYELFIRMFNLNRFKLGYHRNTATIRRRIVASLESNEFYLSLAIDMNFYIFLCFR